MKNRTGRLATVRVAFATPSAGEAQKRDAQLLLPASIAFGYSIT